MRRSWAGARSTHRFILQLLLLAGGVCPLSAQHSLVSGGPYDPGIPRPVDVIGHEIGERFTPHHELMRYLGRLAESPRVSLDTVAHTFEGREVVMAIVTSEANQQRLDAIRAGAARLADPRGTAAAELSALAARLPSIAWLGYTVHGSEASGTEAAIALLYQLAAGQDSETRMILDSTVVLIDPVQNPDGHERHVQDVMRRRGALGVPAAPYAMVHEGSWPGARTSHYYFDLNRDWFIHSHPASRGRAAAFLRWWPHVAVDLHEMGSNSTYFFAPPMEPVNKNVDPSIIEWWDIYAAANAAAFDEHGWSFFRREGYDEFYPGYGVSWPILNGAVGMTYEQASSEGGAIRRDDGTILTLHDAASHHYAAAWATLVTTARRRADRVADYLELRRRAISVGERSPLRAVAFEPDAQGRADSLAQRLIDNGIEVRRLSAAAEVGGAILYGEQRATTVRLPAGSYVVDFAQPQGRLARALLEADAELDSTFIREELERRRTGRPDRFYDLTAWSLPFAFRVDAWALRGLPGPLDPVAAAGAVPPSVTPARYGYAWEAGSEVGLWMLAALLADSVRVWYAPYGFRSGEHEFPQGALLVRVAANDSSVHEAVRRHAEASGARVAPLASAMVDEGTDLGSNSVFPIRSPRVALAGGEPVSGYSFGWVWYAFDQRLGYPAIRIDVGELGDGALDDFDVLVLPSASASGLERELGDGAERIADWVRGGGTLITLDAATEWLTSEELGLSRFRLLDDSARVDTIPGAPLPARVPGALVRAVADTLSPLLAGVHDAELPVLVFSDRIFTAPEDVRPGEQVIRYASEPRLRLSGYLWPEVPSRLADTPYLWTEDVGQGRVIAFAGDPNFRDLMRGLLPLFANAVFLGPSM